MKTTKNLLASASLVFAIAASAGTGTQAVWPFSHAEVSSAAPAHWEIVDGDATVAAVSPSGASSTNIFMLPEGGSPGNGKWSN